MMNIFQQHLPGNEWRISRVGKIREYVNEDFTETLGSIIEEHYGTDILSDPQVSNKT